MGFSLFGGRFAQGVEVIVAVEDGAEVNENAVRFGGVHGVLRRAGRRFQIVRG
jgi:phosphotransferase system IIB component